MTQSDDHPLNIYFAGELFTHKDLVGNALLAEAIAELSEQRYCTPRPFATRIYSTSWKVISPSSILTAAISMQEQSSNS